MREKHAAPAIFQEIIWEGEMCLESFVSHHSKIIRLFHLKLLNLNIMYFIQTINKTYNILVIQIIQVVRCLSTSPNEGSQCKNISRI